MSPKVVCSNSTIRFPNTIFVAGGEGRVSGTLSRFGKFGGTQHSVELADRIDGSMRARMLSAPTEKEVTFMV
jgi:hypothetical protein